VPGRSLAQADAFRTLGGHWFRGKAELTEIPMMDDGRFGHRYRRRHPRLGTGRGVKVIKVDLEGSYSLAKHGAAAARALRRLAGSPPDEVIVDFAGRFGPLLFFSEWLSGVRYEMETTRAGARWRLPLFGHSRFESGSHVGSDAHHFQEWCVQQGHTEAAAYVKEAQVRSVSPGLLESVSPHLLLEPTALYVWAARKLTDLERELKAARGLTPATREWLDSRLDETRVDLVTDESGQLTGGLTMAATTLLAYLAVRTVLDIQGYKPEERKCRGCPTPFRVNFAQQRYCSPACGDTYRKRRLRKSRRKRAAGEELSPA
jgi:hypothetical protein